jgi:hypothetical protein
MQRRPQHNDGWRQRLWRVVFQRLRLHSPVNLSRSVGAITP